MNLPWHRFLLVPLVLSLALLVGTQYVFLQGSFHADLGVGRLGDALTLANYRRLFTDSFYFDSLWLTIKLSAITTVATLVIGLPVAYVLARMRSRWGPVLLAVVVAASFVTIVIKVLGLNIIFASNGGLNRLLVGSGLLSAPFTLIGKVEGVAVGLMYFTLAFLVILLYSVVLTIPRSLEEAAQNLGASRWRMHWRVILPLSLPGIVASGLIAFNLCMGAFTSAALIGAGRVLTLPVLIQRTVIFDTKYGMGATLAVVLLVAGLLVNLASILVVSRLKSARGMTA
jgi:putative spermidine/putrescine transport system permease protein